MNISHHFEETRAEAEAAKIKFPPPQYSTGPVIYEPVRNLYYFEIKIWSLD